MKTYIKKDISNTEDIESLVYSFYDKLKKNEKLSRHFTHVNWEHHIPVMCRFWENTLFYTGNYSGNPMEVHKKMHARERFTEEDFSIWIKLFNETLDELFTGEKTELARTRALGIATVMRIKIL